MRSAGRQKDAMQCALIRKVNQELNFDVDIVVVPTVREKDGLAMSSRNVVSRHLPPKLPSTLTFNAVQYLSTAERRAAPSLFRALLAAKETFTKERLQSEHVTANVLIEAVEAKLHDEPLFSRVEYISVAAKDDIRELTEVGTDGAIISAAVSIGHTRLIDNVVI